MDIQSSTEKYVQLEFDFHFEEETKKKRRTFTEEELEYICRFYEFDGPTLLAAALEVPMKSIVQKVYSLRKSGKYNKYKNQRKYWAC